MGSRCFCAPGSLPGALSGNIREPVWVRPGARSLRSDAAPCHLLWTLIGKALESENAEALVARLFESGLADQFIDRLLTSKAVWRLVNEIAASTAVTAAVTQQGLGFADQVGDELRARSRQADDWILYKARRDSNGDGTSPPGNESARSAAGHLQALPAVAPRIGPGHRRPGCAAGRRGHARASNAPPDRRHLHPSRVGERC